MSRPLHSAEKQLRLQLQKKQQQNSGAPANNLVCDLFSDILHLNNMPNAVVKGSSVVLEQADLLPPKQSQGSTSKMASSTAAAAGNAAIKKERLTFPQIWVESVCESSSGSDDDLEDEDEDEEREVDDEDEEKGYSRKQLKVLSVVASATAAAATASATSGGGGGCLRRRRRRQGLCDGRQPKDKVIRSLLTSCSTDVSFERSFSSFSSGCEGTEEAGSNLGSGSGSSPDSSLQNSFQINSRENSVEDFSSSSPPSSSSPLPRPPPSSSLAAEENSCCAVTTAEAAGPRSLLTPRPTRLASSTHPSDTVGLPTPPEKCRGATGPEVEKESPSSFSPASAPSAADATGAILQQQQKQQQKQQRRLDSDGANDKYKEVRKCSSSSSNSSGGKQSIVANGLSLDTTAGAAALPQPFHTPVACQIDSWLRGIELNGFDTGLLQSFDKSIDVEENDGDDDGDGDEDEEVDEVDETWFEKGLVRVFDPYYDLSQEDVTVVEGRVNAKTGNPIGMATIKLHNGDELYGTFRNGYLRQGRGSVEGSNLLEHGLLCLRGFYKDGVLCGMGRAVLAPGSLWTELDHNVSLEGVFNDGYLEGPVRGMDDHGNLVFVGEYARGLPTGCCWLAKGGQGWLFGQVDARGRFSGQNIVYLYPDRVTCLAGHFQAEVMLRAFGRLVCAAKLNAAHVLCLVLEDDDALNANDDDDSSFYSYCPSNCHGIHCDRHLPDVYESVTVACLPSKVNGAGDGLFARRDIPKNTLLAYYNGVRVWPGEPYTTANANYQIYVDWSDTDHSPFVDIPVGCTELEQYRASLAHKANHSFDPNCQYVSLRHPRFGHIPALKSIRDIIKGEELFSHYKYDMALAPHWYQQAWEHFSSTSPYDPDE